MPIINFSKSSNKYAFNYRQFIPSINENNKTWQRYVNSKRIYAPEPDSNAPDCTELDSNTEDCASQSDFYTPTVTTCWYVIKIIPLKGEYEGWVLIYVVDNNYVPVIYLNSEEFKQQETPIKLGIRKKRGPDSYEEEPSIGMIIDMYFPTVFM